MKGLVSTLWAFLLLGLLAGTVHGQVTVDLALGAQQATLADAIEMTVRITGARNADASPTIAGLESFQVTPAGSSSRVEILQGRVQAAIVYSYMIRPTKPGAFDIGPARVLVDGTPYESQRLRIEIIKGPSPGDRTEAPVDLEASLSRSKAYLEEHLLYTLRLFIRASISDVSLRLPQVEHMTFQSLGRPREYKTVHEGRSVDVLEVHYALIPLQEGLFEVPPARMDLTLIETRQRQQRGLFDHPFFGDPFFRSGRPLSVTSQPLPLEVLPLPLEGRPPDFGGLVGAFQMESSLSHKEVNVGESTTLVVRISGSGNVQRIPDLRLPSIPRLKVYEDQPDLNVGVDEGGIKGTKTMRWALVPEKDGVFTIPPLSLSFFDAQKKTYKSLTTPSYTLEVLPSKEQMLLVQAGPDREGAVLGPAKQEVTELGFDILPIQTSLKGIQPSPGSRALQGGGLFWVLVLGPILGYAGGVLGVRLRERSVRSLPTLRAKKAAQTLNRAWAKADHDPGRLILALRDYVNARFGLSLATLTPEEMERVLLARGVGTDAARALADILRGMERAVYAGARPDPGLGRQLPGLIQRIEKDIR